jgi:uncharacterized protein YndB with AHSA1/START domain
MHTTAIERTSNRELIVTRAFNAPARSVFEAWAKPALMKQWWVPKSMGMSLLSCEMDARTGGRYRFEFKHPAVEQPLTFFGTYVDVIPGKRLVWTNEESDQGAVTTVTFEEKGGTTLLTLHDLYPTKEAFDAGAEGTEACMPEQLEQLDGLLASLSSHSG